MVSDGDDARRLAAWMATGGAGWVLPHIGALAGVGARLEASEPHLVVSLSRRPESDGMSRLRAAGWMCDGERVWPTPELQSQALCCMCLKYGDF